MVDHVTTANMVIIQKICFVSYHQMIGQANQNANAMCQKKFFNSGDVFASQLKIAKKKKKIQKRADMQKVM